MPKWDIMLDFIVVYAPKAKVSIYIVTLHLILYFCISVEHYV